MKPANSMMLHLLVETVVASLALLAMMALVMLVIFPAQRFLCPGLEGYSSLLFLPHGVRVLAAWLLGWRSIVALAPGAVIGHAWFFGDEAFAWPLIGVLVLHLVVAPLTFEVLARLGVKGLRQDDAPVYWRNVLMAGAMASLPNAVLANALYGAGVLDYLAYVAGDVFGLIFLFGGLLMILPLWRRRVCRACQRKPRGIPLS